MLPSNATFARSRRPRRVDDLVSPGRSELLFGSANGDVRIYDVSGQIMQTLAQPGARSVYVIWHRLTKVQEIQVYKAW